MEEKVLECDVMTEEELMDSRARRDALDFLLSPAGIDFFGKALSHMLWRQSCE